VSGGKGCTIKPAPINPHERESQKKKVEGEFKPFSKQLCSVIFSKGENGACGKDMPGRDPEKLGIKKRIGPRRSSRGQVRWASGKKGHIFKKMSLIKTGTRIQPVPIIIT